MARAIALHASPAEKPCEVVAEPAPAAAVPVNVWESIRQTMPARSLIVLVISASDEMSHLALALSAAREAGESEHIRHYRHALAGLARNFGLDDLDQMIRETRDAPRSLNMSAVFALIEDWRRQHMLH